ncbi:MAG TPA: M56 family metallopeptidase [Pyrinomonadaceae bacterium]|nr:M56 family metallopeptidase [Pyrinomonadaceae bacterium]
MTSFYEWLAEASLWWWPRFADHLWQTTLFVLVVVVAAFTLRQGPARLRHHFWLLASAKFIVPAVLFVFMAQQTGIDSLEIFRGSPQPVESPLLVNGVTEPVSAIASDYEGAVVANPSTDPREIYLALTAVWLTGCAALVLVWAIRRQRFLRSLKLGRGLQTGREWEALMSAKVTLGFQARVGLVISPLHIEPAAYRVWRPVVVMPESIASQLDDGELEAIMLHELAHIQRRDNLIGNLQLALCALLWFHPLVWFISRKLFDEREQACDEKVLEVCGEPEAYASSILKVVRFCVGWKLAGVTGAASGSNLRRRIENIMATGNKKPNGRAASSLLAAGLVGMAFLVLVGAGVYSKAQERKTDATDAAVVEMAPPGDAEVVSNTALDMTGAPAQKGQKGKTPPPPPPAAPAPAQAYQPSQPPQTPEPAQAPAPSQVPLPAQPAQPAQAPAPPSTPNPAQAPQPPAAPEPGPEPPAAASFGVGKGRGIVQGTAPRAATTIGGRGGSKAATAIGQGVSPGVATSISGTVSSRAATAIGRAGAPRVATTIGQGAGVGKGVSVGGAAPRTRVSTTAPAAPVNQAMPARQEKPKTKTRNQTP